jgi:hypothetical protein
LGCGFFLAAGQAEGGEEGAGKQQRAADHGGSFIV